MNDSRSIKYRKEEKERELENTKRKLKEIEYKYEKAKDDMDQAGRDKVNALSEIRTLANDIGRLEDNFKNAVRAEEAEEENKKRK